jgi:peptidoglycan/xylan/chitin deacetylase (PgdA/CDA1 family)
MPTPTVHQVTFAEMNQKYGPCAKVSVLMYHHIQPEAVAKKLKQTSLTVDPEWFDKQLSYLIEKGYTIISPNNLVNFFNSGVTLPAKSVMITLDDAYEDNYIYAWPILKKYNMPATVFTPTGLVMVMDYLSWGEISEMANGGVYFGNHTWSHRGSTGSPQELDKEIRLADGQLAEKGLNRDKIFAYPYGKPSFNAEEVLQKYGYSMAFTTKHGNILCQKQRFELPRIRVGNAPLSNYGL